MVQAVSTTTQQASHGITSGSVAFNATNPVMLWQKNLQHSKSASVDFSKQLETAMSKTDSHMITCLQEPYNYKNRVCLLTKQCDLFFQGKAPRTAILSSKQTNLVMIPSLSDRDTTVCQWSRVKDTILIASVYLDITKPTISEGLEKAVNFARNEGWEVIICMDSNAHSTIWGNPINNPRGDELELFIMSNNLHIHNIGCQSLQNLGPVTGLRSLPG